MTAAQAAVYVARPITSYRLLAVGAGARDVGLVAAAFALVPLFLAIPLGRAADRRGGGRLLVGGCGIQTVACVLLSQARTPLELGAATAILGVGHLGLALGVQEVIARESPPERHDEHFGLLTAGVSIGQLVGPVLGGVLLQHRGGTSLSAATARIMLVGAVIALGATVCAALAERRRPAPATAHASTTAGRGNVRAILGTSGVPAAIFASIAVLSAADVFTAYMPVLGAELGIAPAAVGVLLGLRAAASLASRVGIGAIVRAVGRVRLLTLSAVAAAAAFVGMTFTSELWLLAPLAIVAGFGLGFGQPLSMTSVVQLVPFYARGTALAVRLTGNRLGQVAAPALAGLVAGGAGTRPVFWMMSGTLAAAAVTQRPVAAHTPSIEPATYRSEHGRRDSADTPTAQLDRGEAAHVPRDDRGMEELVPTADRLGRRAR
jgi:MFS family permease